MAAETLRAASINLANYMPETHARAVAIANVINTLNLDVIGFQETEEWLEDKLVTLLTGSWMVTSDHVNCPVLARSDKFERVKWKGLYDVNLSMPGSVRKRYGSMGMLRRKSDNLTFVAATIHPSNTTESKNSATDRVKQAEYVWAEMVKWKVLSFPILILGDTNTRDLAPKGLPGVFVANGMTDVLRALNAPISIDRAFTTGFTPLGTSLTTVAKTLSDHPFRVIAIRPTVEPPPVVVIPPPDKEPDPGPLPEPPEETTLERMIRIYGEVTEFEISSFEAARQTGYISRHVAVIQSYLNRETTCVWSPEDEAIYVNWRHVKYPKWPEVRYTGPTDYESSSLLTFVSKQAGKKTYPIKR